MNKFGYIATAAKVLFADDAHSVRHLQIILLLQLRYIQICDTGYRSLRATQTNQIGD